MSKTRWGAMGLLGLGAAGMLIATGVRGEDYSSPTTINRFRKVGMDGTFMVQAQGLNFNNNGSPYAAYYAIDSAIYNWQVNYGSQSVTNTASYRITLPEATHIQTLKLAYGGYRAVQHRIQGSTTGFGSMTDLVGWTNVSVAAHTYTVDTTLQYVQFDFLGTASGPYLQVEEMEAFAGAGDAIGITEGYNLFAKRATATIDSDSGNWGDVRANAIDLNRGSYLRGSESTPVTNWFVVDLGKSYVLCGATVGFYHGQGWPRIAIDVSVDKTTWVPGYNQATALSSSVCPFPRKLDARYVRVTTYSTSGGQNTWGALCELDVFAVPPPAGVSVILK